VLILALGDGFRLLVRPSFAGHLAAWLVDAAEEFRPVRKVRP
jgi:sarcosine oxidase subunit gamma